MKLLIVSYALPPFRSPQSIQIGRLLYSMPSQYDMHTVYAEAVGGPQDDRLYPGIKKRFREELVLPMFFNTYIDILKSRLPLLYKIPDACLYWNLDVYASIIKKWGAAHFDAIVTFAFPFSSHVLGLKLKKHFKTKWIAHFSDPWADNPYNKYDPLSSLVNRWLEKLVVKDADMLIFVSKEMRNAYARKYPKHAHKFFVLEHSLDPSLYSGVYKKSQKFVMRYIGNFYGSRTPEALLKALHSIVKSGAIKKGQFVFEIIGTGLKIPHIIEKYGLRDIVVHKKPVDYLSSLKLMREADVLVVIDAETTKTNVFLPSKLIDYLGAYRPLFGITPKNSPSARVVTEAGGLVAEPRNINSIISIIKNLIEYHEEGSLNDFVPRAQVVKQYSIKNRIREFKKLISTITSSQKK